MGQLTVYRFLESGKTSKKLRYPNKTEWRCLLLLILIPKLVKVAITEPSLTLNWSWIAFNCTIYMLTFFGLVNINPNSGSEQIIKYQKNQFWDLQVSQTFLMRFITTGTSLSDKLLKQSLNHPGSMQWQQDPGITLILPMFKSLFLSSISPFSL